MIQFGNWPNTSFMKFFHDSLVILCVLCVALACSSDDQILDAQSDVTFSNDTLAIQDTATEDLTIQDTKPVVPDAVATDNQLPPIEDTTAADTVSVEDTTTPPPDGPSFNEGWIGGPCDSDADCDYDGGYCLTEAEGFPDGLCSLDCDLYCPDEDGMVVTFCIGPAEVDLFGDMGLCTSRCDFSKSNTGCRPGYNCELTERHNDPGTQHFACLPDDGTGTTPVLSDCHEELSNRGVGFSLGINPMDSPSGHPDLVCNIVDPVWVEPTIHGVTFRYASPSGAANPIFASCPLALAMEETAALVAPQGVTDIIHLGVYNCRVISGTNTLSEHGLANAIDIKSVVLSDGSVYDLLSDWEKGVAFPVTDAGSFLKWLAHTMFEMNIYNIILTPEYNAAHADHFHCDLTEGAYFME